MKYYDHFLEKLDKLMTTEDFNFLKDKIYQEKKQYIELKIKDLLKGESKEFIVDVALNKDKYLTECCCQWSKLYPILTAEQKIIVLTNIYCLYKLNPDGTRTYADGKMFLKILDEGLVNRYKVSAVGHTTDYMRDLPNLIPSDVLFWLQHEWHKLSGDWFEKIKNKDYVSRNTTRFTPRNYQAFNEIFKQCFGRELKCIERYRDKTLIDEFKEILGNNGE